VRYLGRQELLVERIPEVGKGPPHREPGLPPSTSVPALQVLRCGRRLGRPLGAGSRRSRRRCPRWPVAEVPGEPRHSPAPFQPQPSLVGAPSGIAAGLPDSFPGPAPGSRLSRSRHMPRHAGEAGDLPGFHCESARFLGVACGLLDQLHPGGEAEFGVDVGEVGLHGAR
jgi:hypothetical protein